MGDPLASEGHHDLTNPPCLHSITSTVACDMDLAKYPMDEQECMLDLESCECSPRGGAGSFLESCECSFLFGAAAGPPVEHGTQDGEAVEAQGQDGLDQGTGKLVGQGFSESLGRRKMGWKT